MLRGKRSIVAAAAQIPAVPLGQATHALHLIETAFDEAARKGADLLVLPECAYPAYLLGSREAYFQSERLPNGQFLERLGEWAGRSKLHAICGFVEEREGRLFNSAAVIDSSGRLSGVYRKSFLWGDDQHYFDPGDKIEPIDTSIGRLGIAICADLRCPEILAALTHQGAQLIAVPTCWVHLPGRDERWPSPQPEILVPARVSEFGVPFVCANKYGPEGPDVRYCGLSRIVAATNHVLAEAGQQEEMVITAEIPLSKPIQRKVPYWAAARILTPESALRPPAEDDLPVTLALVPKCLMDTKSGKIKESTLLDRFVEQNVEAVIAHVPSEAKAERFDLSLRNLGMSAIAASSDFRVMYESFGSYGCVEGEDALSFAALRALALDGAALLVVFDAPDEPTLLRARALENRCFLAATFEARTMMVGPDGRIIAESSRSSAEPLIVSVRLAEAAHKEVYANTDIWNQRRPDVYAGATHLGLDV